MSTNRYKGKAEENFAKKSVEEQKKISRDKASQSTEKPLNENLGIENAKKIDKERHS